MIKQTTFCITLFLVLLGCQNQQVTAPKQSSEPNYSKPLPLGQPALRQVALHNWPDLSIAWESKDLFLQDAIRNSIRWFDAPSSKQWFPKEGITHEQAKQSIIAFEKMLLTAPTKEAFLTALQSTFDLYQSVGYDGNGTVLFTGYYAPDFEASRYKTPTFKVPLYTRPFDLVTDPTTGVPKGRMTKDGTITRWPARKELLASGMLDGTELVWVKDALDAYIIHVNGSARLRMSDGTLMFIGYAGKTDRPYTGLGHAITEAGLLPADQLSLRGIRRAFDKNPQQISALINKNESFVFFQEYSGENWPSGSLGVPVTPERSVATDKNIFPRGGVIFVDTTVRSLSGQRKPFTQFMTDQDTGGAIRAPGRTDLYMGVGAIAGIRAGGQYDEGQLYYFFLKPSTIATANN